MGINGVQIRLDFNRNERCGHEQLSNSAVVQARTSRINNIVDMTVMAV